MIAFYKQQYGSEDHEFERVATAHNGEIVTGREELPYIHPDELRDVDRLARRFNGPRIFIKQENAEDLTKEWVEYVGERGGEGWRNTLTGEIRYQDQPPGGSTEDITVPDGMGIEGATKVLSSVVGATVVQSLKSQLQGGGGSFDVETLVTATALYAAQEGIASLTDIQERLNESDEDETQLGDTVTVSDPEMERDIEITDLADKSEIIDAIQEVEDDQTVAELATQIPQDAGAEEWIKAYGAQTSPENLGQLQDAIDSRIRERTVSLDGSRRSVDIPKDLTVEQAKDEIESALSEDDWQFVSSSVGSNPTVDEESVDAWVKTALNVTDEETVEALNNRFDTQGDSITIEDEGVEAELELPSDLSREDVENAIRSTFKQDVAEIIIDDVAGQAATGEELAQAAMKEADSTAASEGEAESEINRLAENLAGQSDLVSLGEDEQSPVDAIQDYEPPESPDDSEPKAEDYAEFAEQRFDEGDAGNEVFNALTQEAGLSESEAEECVIQTAEDMTEVDEGEATDNVSLAMNYNSDVTDTAASNFREVVGDEAADRVEDTLSSWNGAGRFSEGNAALWQLVGDTTGNQNIPENPDLLEVDVDTEDREAFLQHKRAVEQTLEDVYGEGAEIPVYRTVSRDVIENPDTNTLTLSQRPLEGWSSDLRSTTTQARSTDNVVIRGEVPIEDIWGSSVTGHLSSQRNEFLIGMEEQQNFDMEQDVITDPDNSEKISEWAGEMAEFGSKNAQDDDPQQDEEI